MFTKDDLLNGKKPETQEDLIDLAKLCIEELQKIQKIFDDIFDKLEKEKLAEEASK